MIKDLPEGETQYDHFDELIAQLRVARDNFYRSKAMEVASLREECETLRRERDTLRKEIRNIGAAINDDRTDLTLTMCEVITDIKRQLAAMTAERDAEFENEVMANELEKK